jgi:beta-glucosidase
MTLNEMRSFVDVSYYLGSQAPGLRLQPAELYQVRHHAVLAHGLGVQAIRSQARAGTQVGLAENPTIPVPVIESPEHVAAARKAMRATNAGYLTAVMEGRYLDEYLAQAGANAPRVETGDMRAIGSPLDFVALNVYAPTYVRAAPETPAGFIQVPKPKSYPQMTLPWLSIGPEGLYWGPRLACEAWRPSAIYISENGCVSDDTPHDGRVDDIDRIMFLRNYLTHLQRAAAEGYPIKGYFACSLMDNFEWSEGFSKRFGLYYTDYKTQRRIPKLSAAWFRELTRRNAVV